MAELKKLSNPQIAALTLLNTGAKRFSRFSDIGIQGQTTAWLVKNGLATVLNWPECGVNRLWAITDTGRKDHCAANKSETRSKQ